MDMLAATTEEDIGAQALKAKNARVKAEQDLQLLQNRINRLVIEEERAAKRIAETRRRAKEIWELKRQNAANQVSQQEASEWMTAEQNLQRELLLQTRTERMRSIDASRSAVHQMRKEEVNMLRQMRRENEEAVQAQRELERQRCIARKEFVQSEQRVAQQRKTAEKEAALKKLRDEREHRRELIHDDASAQMRVYADMAEEERRLVSSLEACQKDQEDAYHSLESTLRR